MPRSVRLSFRRALALGAALLLSTLSCGREVTGPGGGVRLMRGFTFEARFGPEGLADGIASDVVAYDRVRVLLVDSRGRSAVDRVVNFPSTDSVVSLAIDVPLGPGTPAEGEVMQLSLAYINAVGDTVFRGGPLPVSVIPTGAGGPPPAPPVVPVQYVGPGANATAVVVAPRADTVVAGDAFAFTAVAQDGQGQPVNLAPIAWRSISPTIATITNPAAGAGTTLPSRGQATIIAQLLTGPADTVTLTVLPRAQALATVSGGGQAALVGALLPQPVVVRVTATDGQPMEGVPVTFAPANGGAVGTPAAVTNAFGLAQTTWTLGGATGAQTLSVTATGVSTPLTVTATASLPPVTLRHHYPMTSGVDDAQGAVNGTFVSGALTVDGVLVLNGDGAYVTFPSSLVPATGNWSISMFVRPRGLGAAQAYLSQGAAGGPGLVVGSTATDALRVGETWPATGVPAPAADGLFHHVVLVADSIAGSTRLYVDGALRATQPSAVTVGAAGTATRLGRSFDALLEYFDGDLDELRVYSGALDAATIAGLFNAGVTTIDRLVFGTQPSTVLDGAVIAPAVTVRMEDAMGRLRTGFTGPVTMALAPGSNGTLGGTLTVNAVAGVATFADLTVTGGGIGVRLLASAAGASDAESVPFDVTGGVPLNAWATPTSGTWGTAANWSLGRVPQAGDSVVIAGDGAYTVTLDVPATMASLVVGGGTGAKTLNVSNQTLATTNGLAVFVGHGLRLVGGTVGGAGPVENFGLITMEGGFIAAPLVNTGTVLVRGGQGITGPLTTVAGSTIRVQGNGGVGPVGLTVANGFVNHGLIDLTSADGAWDAALTVQAGTLQNAADGFISASSAAGGNRYLSGNLVNVGTISSGTALLFLSGTLEQTAAGTISGGGNLRVSGGATLRLLDGTIAVAVENGGTLEASGANVLSGGFTNGTGALLRVGAIGTATGGTQLTVATDFTNSGTIELTNQRAAPEAHDATLAVSGTLTNAVGGTIRSLAGNGGGVRAIGGTLVNNGLIQVAPGAAGELELNGAFSNAGTVAVEIGGTAPGTQYDRLAVNGTTTLGAGGVLNVTLIGGYVPTVGTAFDVLTAPTVTGTFTTVNAAAPLLPTPTYTGTSVRLSGPVALQANAWTNAAGGAWSTPANWSLGRAPTASDTVLITLDGTYTVTLDGETQVTYLLLGGASGAQTLAMGAWNLTVDSLMNVGAAGVVTAGSGNILGTGALVNGGSMDVNNRDVYVPVTNTGTMVLRGGSDLRAPTTTTAGSMLRLLGSAAGGNSSVNVTNDLTNGGTIELTSIEAGYSANLVFTIGRRLTNLPGGVIRTLPGAGGNRGISGLWDNQGLMDINTSVTFGGVDGAYTNSGTIALNDGLFELYGPGTAPSFTNTGTIALGPNVNFRPIGSGTVMAVDVTGGTITGATGIFAPSSATLRMTTGAVGSRVNLQGVTLLDPLTIPAGDTLRLNDGAIEGPGLVNEGVLQVFGSPQILSPFANAAGAQLLVRGNPTGGNADLWVANGFTNAGEILLSSIGAGYSARLQVTTGTLVNAPTGTITAAAGNGGSRTLAAELDNQGRLTVAAPLTLGRADAAHVNRDTIDVTLGNLTVVQTGTAPSFTNAATGVVRLSNGRTFTANGGLLDLRAGVVRNDSAFVTTTGAATVRFATTTVEPRVTFSAATVLPDPFTVPGGDSLRVLGGTFAPPSLVNDGTLILEGTTTVTTAFTMADTSRLLLRGIQAGSNASATFTNGFTNTGRIDLTSEGGGYASSLAVATGTLVNAPQGTIVAAQGAGGTRTLGAQLDNRGTLDIASTSGLTLARADAAHLNSGTIRVASGNLTLTQTGTAPSFTNEPTGVVRVGANRTWSTSGGLLDLRTGLVTDSLSGRVQTSGTSTLRFLTGTVQPRLVIAATTALPDPFVIPGGDSLRLLAGTFAPPSLRNDGTLILENAAFVNTAFTMADTALLLVRGIAIGSNVNATFANGFTNTGRIALTSEGAGYGASLAVTAGTLVNTGTIDVLQGAGGTRTLTAALDNQGDLNVATTSGLTVNAASAAHVNSGTIDVTAGILNISQSGTTPSFTNAPTGAVNLGDGRTLQVSGGLLDLRTGIVRNDSAFVSTTGATTVRFLTTTVEPRVTFAAATVFPDAFTVPGGDSLRILGGTFAPPSLRNDGTLILEGQPTVTTAYTMADTSRLVVRGIAAGSNATATFTNPFTNLGAIELLSVGAGYSSELAVPTGTFVNGVGGTITARAGAGGTRTLAAELRNEGQVTLETGLTLARADAAHYNVGTIAAITGDLTLTQSGTAPSFTNDADGIVQLASGRVWNVNGGLLDLRVGQVLGRDARLNTNATSTVRFTTGAVHPRVTFAAGATLPDPLLIPYGDSLRVLGGTIAPPSLQVQGVLALEGTTTVTSAVASDSGSRIVVRGIANGANATATFTSGFSVGLDAYLDLTSVGAGYNATLNVTAGSLTNFGQLTAAAGAGGTRAIGAQLVNQGVVQIDAATTLARADAAHVNAALANIAVFGGNLTVTQTGTAPTFTNNSTINVATGRSFIGNGGTFELEAGTIQGQGTFSTTGTTVVRFQPADVRMPFTLSAGTTVPVAFVIPQGADTVQVRGGTFAPTSLVNNGGLLLEGTAIVNTASFTNAATGLVRVQGIAAAGNASAQVPQGLTNNGILRITSIGAGYASALSLGTATLTNAAGATIDLAADQPGARTLTAGAIENLGTIVANQTGTINGPIAQRSLLTVAALRTLTLTSPLTLYSGSTVNVLTGGTLTASGGCTNLGALSLFNFLCP